MSQALWPTIIAGITAAQSGHAVEGEKLLSQAWMATGPEDHACRCVIAHYLADLQSQTSEELRWDQLAVQAHEHIADEKLAPLGIQSAAGFLPSLHLNLGHDWLRPGNLDRAKEHLHLSRGAEATLGDDPYVTDTSPDASSPAPTSGTTNGE